MADDPEAQAEAQARGNAGVTTERRGAPPGTARDANGQFLPGYRGGPRNRGGRPFSARGFFRKLAMPKRYRFLVPVIEGRVAALAADKGGPEHMTAGEIALLDLYRRAHGTSLLLLAEANERGFVRADEDGWDLHPGAREIARFAEMERRCLMDLGLERRAKPVPSVAEYVENQRKLREGGEP